MNDICPYCKISDCVHMNQLKGNAMYMKNVERLKALNQQNALHIEEKSMGLPESKEEQKWTITAGYVGDGFPITSQYPSRNSYQNRKILLL